MKYFSVSAFGDSREHIATIEADYSNDLKDMLQVALQDHYDSDVVIKTEINIESYINGLSGTVDIKVGADYLETILIQQTWLYSSPSSF